MRSFYIILSLSFITLLISCKTNKNIYNTIKDDISIADYQMVKNDIEHYLKMKFPNTPSERFKLRENWLNSRLGWGFPENTEKCQDSLDPILKNNQNLMMQYDYYLNDSVNFTFFSLKVSRCRDISIDSPSLLLIDYLENKGVKNQYSNVLNILEQRKIYPIDISLKYDSSSNTYANWRVVYFSDKKSNTLPCVLISTVDNAIVKDTVEPIIGR